MSRPIKKGATDQSTVIRIVDSSDGTPETGVTSATSGLDLKYRREGAATANLTESDLSALTDAHSDGGMLHIGAGYYRIDLPDAAVATGADGVLVFGTVTGMVVIAAYHPLVDNLEADTYAIVSSGTHGNAALKTLIDDVPTNAELATSQAAADDATLAAIAALNNLSAAQVNAEVDTAISDAALVSKLDAILADTGTDGVVISSSTRNSIATALLDLADGVEPASGGTERTVREALRLILSACAGKAAGLGTTTATYRDTNDSKNRISATVDADGNRTAVTLDDT